MIHSPPRRVARLSRWLGRDRQLTQGKFGSGIAQSHTPILGLPPVAGIGHVSDPFPQSQNEFVWLCCFIKPRDSDARPLDGHRGPECHARRALLRWASRRWRDLEDGQPPSHSLPNCLTGPRVVFLGWRAYRPATGALAFIKSHDTPGREEEGARIAVRPPPGHLGSSTARPYALS